MDIKKNIFLVGMPASGKSTVGKSLAEQLGFEFIDLDKIIINKEDMPITEIFEVKGEAYFREKEKKYLNEVIESREKFLLATGGGAPCYFDNMEKMNQAGITIFINVSVDDLFKKLSVKGTNKRPLLKGLDTDRLYFELSNKLKYRKKFYSQAIITVNQQLGDVSKRADTILKALKNLEKHT